MLEKTAGKERCGEHELIIESLSTSLLI